VQPSFIEEPLSFPLEVRVQMSALMRTLVLILMASIVWAADEPSVPIQSLMISTVRRGDLVRVVEGYGKMESRGDGFEARIKIREKANDVRVGQPALIDVGVGLFHGEAVAIEGGEIRVKIDDAHGKLKGGEDVVVSIEVERVNGVLTTERFGVVGPDKSLVLYRVSGDTADRVNVRTGRTNGRLVEVLEGLADGDRVIVTPMQIPNDTPRVRIAR
jgi:hypothetical protein